MEDINKFCTNCHWCLNTEELEEDSQEIFSEPVCARTPTIINRGNIFGCIQFTVFCYVFIVFGRLSLFCGPLRQTSK